MKEEEFVIVYVAFRHYSDGTTEILGVYENKDEAYKWTEDDWNNEVTESRYYTDGGTIDG